MAAELEEAKKPTLERLYDGSKQQLLLESGVFSNLTDHAGEKGRANEDHLRRILRGFLPGKMGLGTGFVEAPGNVRSKQQDIVIWEQLNNFPLYEGESWSIYPVECVYGTIEVKTQINSALLKESLDACAQIREMAKGKCYLIENEGATKAVEYLRRIHDLPPRFFIVAYRSAWRDFESFRIAFEKASLANNGAHIHGLCVVDRDWFIAKNAFEDSFYSIQEGGWIKFLNKLHLSCESMRLSALGITDWSRYLEVIDPPNIQAEPDSLSRIELTGGKHK